MKVQRSGIYESRNLRMGLAKIVVRVLTKIYESRNLRMGLAMSSGSSMLIISTKVEI